MAKLVAVCSYGVMGKFSNLLLVVVTSMTLSTWFPYRAKRLVHGPSLDENAGTIQISRTLISMKHTWAQVIISPTGTGGSR